MSKSGANQMLPRNDKPTALSSLPIELVRAILKLIQPKQLLPLRRVSRAFNAVLATKLFAKMHLQMHPIDARLLFELPLNYQIVYTDTFLVGSRSLEWSGLRTTVRPVLIPITFGRLQDLSILSLTHNTLHGPIPVDIMHLSQLKMLNLSHNQLTGIVPNEIYNLESLEVLDCSYNQLSGSIPRDIGNLERLRVLLITDCRLTGNIPRDISNLKNLQELGLDRNRLLGSVPDLSELQKLRCVGLSGNMLSGEIPANIRKLRQVNLVDLRGNDGLKFAFKFDKLLY